MIEVATKKGKKSHGRTAAQNRAQAEGKIAPNMYELGKNFGTEEQCERKLIELRWPDGFECE